jgi:hypothetical protein
MACASRVQRQRGIVVVMHSLEEMFGDPDFLAQATAAARRNARGGRLAVILQSARPLMAELTSVERPLDLLDITIAPADSPAETFTTISTLFFVPWAHAECSQKVTELQRTGDALRRTRAEVFPADVGGTWPGTRVAKTLGSSPLTAFYDAVALDWRARARTAQARTAAGRFANPINLQERKVDYALQEYTKALTAWMRSVLGS